jgi:hypothetical protein
MGQGAADSRDRRRDLRVTPAGRVRVEPLVSGEPLDAPLGDVSAGGLRVRVPDGHGEGLAPRRGTRVRLEVRLDDPADPTGPPRLVLDGTGEVKWTHEPVAGPLEVGIAFDEPLAVRRPFPEVRVF